MKPYITTFVISDDIKDTPNQNGGHSLNVINPQNLLRPAFVPGTYSFAITCGLLGVNTKKSNKFRLKIMSENPDEEPIVDTKDADLPPMIEPRRADLPDEANGFILNMDFRNLPFRTEGKYTVKILLNGECLGKYSFMVYAQER